MDKISVKNIADFIGGKLVGDDIYINRITTDSREAFEGTAFIGIKGEKVDGNDFAVDFLEKGGSCVVIEKDIHIPNGKTAIMVEDTKKAIRDIAEFYRTTLKIDVVAVTGSVGKTSTKEMLNCVIEPGFSVFSTKGNFNNEIGVPLTVFQLDSSYEKAVVEMGMSNLGEISRLTKIAKPQVAVITNIGTAHIGNLGSQENILKAKLEVLECLDSDGLVILNGDDEFLWDARESISHRVLYYGIENQNADYVAYDVKTSENGSRFKMIINGETVEFSVPVVGIHHIYNAMAAIICGLNFGMEVEKITRGVGKYATTGMRQKEIEIGRVKIIEDCYNASLDSMKSSIDVLVALSENGRSIAVLADMLEQGSMSESLHRQVGDYVADKKIDVLICVGKDAKYIADQATSSGAGVVYTFDDNKSATEYLCNFVVDGDFILLKGSRGMKLEEISTSLQEHLKGRM